MVGRGNPPGVGGRKAGAKNRGPRADAGRSRYQDPDGLDLGPPRSALRQRDERLRGKYGISLFRFWMMLDAQNYMCLICGTDDPGTTKGWQLDHNHTTGEVRGILCKDCNTTLGWVERHGLKIWDYLGSQP